MASQPQPSPLLALPAELRLRIYEACLAPTGCLHLTSTATHRKTIAPRITPSLLGTCRQISLEASPALLGQNSLCITVDAQAIDTPLIPSSRLPQTVLEKIQRVCLILDCTATFRAPFTELDLNVLTAFIGLTNLRVAVVLRTDPDAASEAMRASLGSLLGLILERIPARARVEYGVVAGSEEERIAGELAMRRQGTFRREQRVVVVVVGRAELEGRVGELPSDLEKGRLSGGVADVFAECPGGGR